MGEFSRLAELPEVLYARVTLDPRGVREQVADGDGVPLRRIVGQISGHVVIKRDLTLLNESHDCCGGELLGDRADAEDRLRVSFGIMLDFSQSVALSEDYVAASRDGDGESNTSRFLKFFGNDSINLADE